MVTAAPSSTAMISPRLRYQLTSDGGFAGVCAGGDVCTGVGVGEGDVVCVGFGLGVDVGVGVSPNASRIAVATVLAA